MAGAWVLLQVADLILTSFGTASWIMQGLILAAALAFPCVLLLAWRYEITPEGIKPASDAEPTGAVGFASRKIDFLIIALLVFAVAFLVVDRDEVPSSADTVLPNSIAVLPLTNLSPDPDDAYFAAGIHEEILNQLARIGKLSVISRTSMLRYANSGLSIPEIADELNVEAVLEGSVRYANDRVRVSAQLIDAELDEQLWSEVYERDLADIFAIQSDIATNIARALEAEFSPAERREIEQVLTESAEAYALYLRAISAARSLGGSEAAHTLLDRAIEIDPGFARAYGTKARLYADSVVNTARGPGVANESRQAIEQQVRMYVRLAFELDPRDVAARDALRDLSLQTWRWSEFEQAVEPEDEANLTSAQVWVYAWMGRPGEAIRLGELHAKLNPQDALAHLSLAIVHAYAGDRASSMRSLQAALEIAPASPLIQPWVAYNEVALGNVENALRELRLLEQLLGDNRLSLYLPGLAYAYSRIGQRRDVDRLYEEIQTRANETNFGAGGWATIYLAIGDEQRALEQLELVAEKARNHEPDQGTINVMNVKMNFLADPTLEQPEFVEVLARIRG